MWLHIKIQCTTEGAGWMVMWLTCAFIHPDYYSLVEEEVNEREVFETVFLADQKSNGAQPRNRTTFTPEQSRALERGSFQLCRFMSNKMLHFVRHFCLPMSEFAHHQYADMYTRERLSAEIKLPEDTIKV